MFWAPDVQDAAETLGEPLGKPLRTAAMKGGSMRRQGGLLVFAALLAVLIGAVPVLARESTEGVVPAEGSETSIALPSAEQVAEGMEKVEEEEAVRQRELESPEAAREREVSESAYTELSESQSRQLLLESFPEEIAALEADPARSLADLHLLRVPSETVATVRGPEGETSLLESSVPVRTENAEGELEKVNLELSEGQAGFEPENPLTELTIPPAANEPIEVGEVGLAITQQAGQSQGQSLHGTDVYYPEVATDTDMMVSPIGAGVEIFDQLRSAQSPEALHFQLRLPGDAVLRPDSIGGAEVVEAERTIAVVPPPTAVDAQGTVVPLDLETEGQTLTLRVRHQSGEYAFPILVDPAVQPISENYEGSWSTGSNLDALETPGVWQVSGNDETQKYILRSTHCIDAALCPPSGRGLFLTALNTKIPAGTYTEWSYTVPGETTFIPSIYPEASASFNPFQRYNPATCTFNLYPQPHDFDGAFEAGGKWTWLAENRAQSYGYDTLFTKAKGLAFGISASKEVNLPCRRDIELGGVSVRLDDPEAPTLGAVTGFPTGWTGAGTKFTVTANLSDPGLGVQNAKVYPSGMPSVPSVSEGIQCPGTKTHPCPASRAAQISLAAENFDQGEKKVEVSGWDPTGKVSGTYTTTMKVDREGPEISLSGQLMSAINETEGELSLPTYSLKIEAKDGALTNAETKRSGVKSIEVFLDSQPSPLQTWTQTCAEGSCSMSKTFQLKLAELSAGKHVLKVVAKDQLNQARPREIEFEYIPALGIKDEYVMQYFPLPDGQDHSGEEHSHGPELAVNVMNGNLVFHERDVDVEGPNVDLEVEPVYNSQLPTAQNTEWGDGWTLAQTPQLEKLTPTKGRITDGSGRRGGTVALPAETGGKVFTAALKILTTKQSASAYNLADESGETEDSVVFGSTGETEELETSGPASIDYQYEGGALSEIAVEDPTSSATPPPAPPTPPSTTQPTFLSSFGSHASNGQFTHPADIARDVAGDLWVLDQGRNCLEEFNRAGEYLRTVGSTGSGNGQLSRPNAVAIAPNGNLVVADAGNERIEVFSEAGAFIRVFGSAGSGIGQFGAPGPEGVAVDAKGRIWVSDTYHGMVLKFSETGSFLKTLLPQGEPTGLDIAPNGNVFVANRSKNYVSVFDEEGNFVRQFGIGGTGNGQFQHPDEVRIDSRGNVWVGDEGNGRIQEFSQEGNYLGQFGAPGAEEGQFGFTYPFGITSDAHGRFWITNPASHRVQKWVIPGYIPDYSPALDSSFGSSGSGNGQLNHPADVALDGKGTLWVADASNNRIEQFSQSGQYLGKFGTLGSGNGQLNRPAALAIDASGNIWVADSNNNRVEEFNEKGEYLRKFGSYGTGNGSFSSPEGIAIGPEGNVWVSDTYNSRLQVLSPAGEYLQTVGTRGSGPGQLLEPSGLAFGPSGNVFVADWENNCVEEYSASGEFIGEFGSEGSGSGNFLHPFAVEVDEDGVVWVSDQENDRVEAFSEEGEYLRQFGSSGMGAGQFSFGYPVGIATDQSGQLWVTDTNNNRVQKWVTPDFEAHEALLEELEEPNDPAVSVNVASGLVTSVEGPQTGTVTYAYSGDDRIASKTPEGETKFEYTSAGRMKRVELPNGTVGSITYDSTGRVFSVAVDPAGSEPAKTTYFTYSTEPRRTTVTPETGSQTIYEIAEDGSILKWWNTAKAPEVSLAGTLWVDAEKEIPTGLNNLEVHAHSPEGIASIQVLANGNTLVEEETCSQNYETPEIECQDDVAEWVTETADLAPGVLQLEAVVKDRLGNVASRRFWVNVPYTPPPSPEEPSKPTFAQVKTFREAYGLDRDLNPATDQQQINNRIYDLLAAWGNPQTPEGEVARLSAEKWGVPLRPIDVAEMEYREWYMAVDIPLIEEWAEAHRPTTYAGYYVDHRNGGILYVGFTQDQATALSELKQQANLVAPERLATYPTVPSQSQVSLEQTLEAVESAWSSDPYLSEAMVSAGIDETTDTVEVSGEEPSQIEARLKNLLGQNVPIRLVYEEPGVEFAGRNHTNGRILAGDHILGYAAGASGSKNCTAGYGAWDQTGTKPTGEPELTPFVLTAGHCARVGEEWYREPYAGAAGTAWKQIGHGARTGLPLGGQHYETDGSAIKLNAGGLMPYYIFLNGKDPKPVGLAGTAKHGETLCFSGAKTNRRVCGEFIGVRVRHANTPGRQLFLITRFAGIKGDSGAPVWSPKTGRSIGLLSGGPNKAGLIKDWVTPLVLPRGQDAEKVPGILNAPGMGSLNLAVPGP